MSIQLQTQRLLLRRWKESDLEPYSIICADSEVMKWIGNGDVCTRQQCAAAIRSFERSWEENGYGLFAVERRDTGALIGFTGLAIPNFLPEVLPAVEIGWRLAKSAWGNGFATEAAKASMSYGFDACKLDRIVSIHQIGNAASGKIMTKIGMTFERETIDPSCDRTVHVYEVAKENRPNAVR